MKALIPTFTTLVLFTISGCSSPSGLNPLNPQPGGTGGAGGAGGSQNNTGTAAPSVLLDTCTVLSDDIRQATLLAKRKVGPGVPDYCIDAPISALTIAAPVTVEPGVTFELTDGSEIAIAEAGSLNAIGSADAPITFTGKTKGRGAWSGIRFETVAPKNTLKHVVIEYAGAETTFTRASISVGEQTGPRGALSISNTTIREGAAYGVAINNGRFTTFASNTISSHDLAPVVSHLNPLSALDATSIFVGNRQDWIEVAPVSVNVTEPDVNMALKRLGVPYRFTVVEYLDAALEIEAGTTLLFTAEAGVKVESDGAIRALGTASLPVVFDAANGQPGGWLGLAIVSSGDNRLEHTNLLNGGSPRAHCCEFNGKVASLILGDDVRRVGRAHLDHVSIRGSRGFGLYQFPNGSYTGVSVTFADNALGDIGLE